MEQASERLMVDEPEFATFDPVPSEVSVGGRAPRWDCLPAEERRFIDLVARRLRESERVARNPGEAERRAAEKHGDTTA
jgi:hypothetical protein